MEYSVYIRTFHHSEPFRWEEYEKTHINSDKERRQVFMPYIKWALAHVAKKPEGGFHPKIEKWLLENMTGKYNTGAIGIKNKTHIYCYFEKAEDAVLFKLTWVETIDEY